MCDSKTSQTDREESRRKSYEIRTEKQESMEK